MSSAQRPLNLAWRHSSHSHGADSTCVDVALVGTEVLVRDSKDPGGPVLRFSRLEWHVFLLGVRDGEFDLPRSREPLDLPGEHPA